MTTIRHSAYPPSPPAGAHHPAPVEPLPQGVGQYEQLRDFIDRAALGDIDLDVGHAREVSDDGKLPAAWYADSGSAPRSAPRSAQRLAASQGARLRPEALAGLLGLCAGLIVLVPVALWWQQQVTSNDPTTTTSLVTSIAPLAVTDEALLSVSAVNTVRIAKSAELQAVAEARALMADGNMLEARATLAGVVAARDPEGLFLMAETYDPNILAAHRARGVGADTERARALYKAAQSFGHTRASLRLDALR